MPALTGTAVRGIPGGSTGGFIPIDARSKVRGVQRIYAAGDATDFSVKHGGIAAQQADVAAQAIAALAGLATEPPPLHPIIFGMLLTDDKPRYITARISAGHGFSSQITDVPPSSAPAKIAADKEALGVANKATAPLYIANPLKDAPAFMDGLFDTHPPIPERIKRLQAM